jgi:hypothetical protein
VRKQGLRLLEKLAEDKRFRDTSRKPAHVQMVEMAKILVTVVNADTNNVVVMSSLGKDSKWKKQLKKAGWRS